MAETREIDTEDSEFHRRWMAGETPQEIMRDSDSATLASLGIPTEIGDLHICFSPESIVRLGVINSPLVSDGEGGDQVLTDQDLANAVYAMAGGNDAVAPLLGMRQRRQQLDSRLAQAKELGPAFYSAWLEKDMALAGIWTEFETAAMAFYATHCPGMAAQDVADALVSGLNDAYSWSECIVGDGQKKTPAQPTTQNGSETWWGRLSRWASRLIRRFPVRLHSRAG